MTGAAITTGFVLTDLIETQVFEGGVMLCAGMTVALLYQLFCRFKSYFLTKKFVAALFEILFWIASGVITSEFLYYCCFGALSVHVIGAFIIGVLLWNLLFCGKILKGDRRCLNERKKEEVGNSKI